MVRTSQIAFGGLFILNLLSNFLLGGEYAFKVIASSGGEFEWFNGPKINDSGTVVFRVGNSGDVYISNGSTPTLVGRSGFNEGPNINNSGAVSYGADSHGPALSVVTPDGQHTAIVPFGTPLSLLLQHSLNNLGTVSFVAVERLGTRSRRDVVLTGNGGPLTRIADGSQGFWSIGPSIINDRGLVAFSTISLNPTRSTAFMSDGRTTEAVLEAPSGFSIGSLSLNNNDSLGFIMYDAGGVRDAEILINDGDSVRVVADSDGPIHWFGRVSLSDHGDLVFSAELECGGNVILSGNDPVRDRIVGTGDRIMGSPILGVSFLGHHGANNSGQVAFHAWTQDGKEHVLIADPTDGVVRPTLQIGSCDTRVEDLVLNDGCSMGASVLNCSVSAKNHGEFVSCVRERVNDWRLDGVITRTEATQIQNCAASKASQFPPGPVPSAPTPRPATHVGAGSR